MEKSLPPSSSSSSSSSSSAAAAAAAAAVDFFNTDTDNSDTDSSSIYRNHYLYHLNKSSRRISKPQNLHLNHQRRAPLTINHHQLRPHHSSGVYNVDKEDFRSVVQKLTGSGSGSSSSHDRFSPQPPPLFSRNPIFSRLQSIRPPPLDGVRPLFTLPALPPPPPSSDASSLPPLPPFPTGIPEIESPVSAYLRRLQSSTDDADLLWNAIASCSPNLPLQLPDNSFSADAHAAEPPCMLSPTLPVDFAHIPMMSPGVLLSPTTSQIGFPPPPPPPPPPTMSPFPSPTWNDM